VINKMPLIAFLKELSEAAEDMEQENKQREYAMKRK